MSPGASTPVSERRVGVLLSRDLIFTTKVCGTARELGRQMLTAGNEALAVALLQQWRPRVVFVDLAAGELVRPEALVAYRQLAPETRFVAFGAHVDAGALAAAAAAGCDPVLPRSRFAAELPGLIERFL
jgi:DNA-binding NarL/FixJ family response regulator